MKIKEVLDSLEASNEFKEWSKSFPENSLSHIFLLIGNEKEQWQIGYIKDNGKMAAFDMDGKTIILKDDVEVFKQEKDQVKELDISKVGIDIWEALDYAEAVQKDKYKAAVPIKRVVILQNLDIGLVYNITYVTQSFQTLNMKVDAKTGDVLDHKLVDLFQF